MISKSRQWSVKCMARRQKGLYRVKEEMWTVCNHAYCICSLNDELELWNLAWESTFFQSSLLVCVWCKKCSGISRNAWEINILSQQMILKCCTKLQSLIMCLDEFSFHWSFLLSMKKSWRNVSFRFRGDHSCFQEIRPVGGGLATQSWEQVLFSPQRYVLQTAQNPEVFCFAAEKRRKVVFELTVVQAWRDLWFTPPCFFSFLRWALDLGAKWNMGYISGEHCSLEVTTPRNSICLWILCVWEVIH